MADGIINLQTDLTSLKYGSMPLGSDKPLITKNIGQAPGSQIGTEISRRIDDTSRIAQMLISKPGLKYLLHEAQLQQIGVGARIEKARKEGKSVAGAVLGQLGNTLVTTVKIVGSTLAQVPVNGTGTHFLKAFRTDTYLQPTNPGNSNAFTRFFGAGGVEGAKYALRGEEVPGKHESDILGKSSKYDYVKGEVFTDRNETLNAPIPQDGLAAYKTQQGIPIKVSPSGSGIRQTTRSPRGIPGSRSNQLDTILPSEFIKVTGDAPKISGNKGSEYLFDEVVPTEYTYIVQKQNFRTKNNNVTKEARVLLGDQGARNDTSKKVNSYWFTSDPDPMKAAEVDKLNALLPSDGKVDGNTAGRDLIKFRFHILTADGKEKVLYFRAYLDSFADNYTGTWSPIKYLGRAEDFQVYSGFQRKITLSFKIAAATRSEMEPIYQKMIWLASATAPTYATGGQFMRGTITKITVGDYIYELPGVLNSVGYTWNTDYPWEIAMLEPENTGQDDFEQELPMVMDCSIDFTPIHTFTPTTGLKEYITTRLTERGKKGIKDIANEKTGIEPVPEVEPAAAAAAPQPIPAILQPLPEFGPQLPEDVTIGLPGF